MLFSAYASFASFVNTLASYHIGSNVVELEGMPSFVEANLSPSFKQGKHRAYSLYRVFSAYASFASFVNTLASYHIGSNIVELEGMPSFTEANLSPSFNQGKHRAYSLYRVFALQYLHYVNDCALKYRNSMEP
jgi:hypothetical protein